MLLSIFIHSCATNLLNLSYIKLKKKKSNKQTTFFLFNYILVKKKKKKQEEPIEIREREWCWLLTHLQLKKIWQNYRLEFYYALIKFEKESAKANAMMSERLQSKVRTKLGPESIFALRPKWINNLPIPPPTMWQLLTKPFTCMSYFNNLFLCDLVK